MSVLVAYVARLTYDGFVRRLRICLEFNDFKLMLLALHNVAVSSIRVININPILVLELSPQSSSSNTPWSIRGVLQRLVHYLDAVAIPRGDCAFKGEREKHLSQSV